MCGILGLAFADDTVAAYGPIVDGLTVLQHRGQDAAGIVTSTHQQLHLVKDKGLVRDVVSAHSQERLPGPLGLGHVRYPTAGATANCASAAQPLYTNTPVGICVAHNGTITNTPHLQSQMQRHLNTDSDSEVLLNWFAMQLGTAMQNCSSSDTTNDATTTPKLLEPIFTAMESVMTECKGGFAGIFLLHGIGLVAFRDPHGIRPLVWGERTSPTKGEGYLDQCVCSESVALDALGFPLVRDIRPGEALLLDTTPTGRGRTYSRIVHPSPQLTPCIFEYVYFARPDSIMDGISIYQTRLQMGERLAYQIIERYGKDTHGIDVVIPIPDTSRSAALQAAHVLNVPYREGFIKNRYIARTFIMPGQKTRQRNVRLKLNTIHSEFAGKSVLLVDDSIVRGTTATAMIQLAWEAGATRVCLCSAAPPILYPNIYGIDIPTQHELVAYERSCDEIAQQLQCTWVVYQTLEDLTAAVAETKGSTEKQTTTPTQFETSCFSGEYVTGESIDDPYFAALHAQRNDAAQHGTAHTTTTTTTTTTSCEPITAIK